MTRQPKLPLSVFLRSLLLLVFGLPACGALACGSVVFVVEMVRRDLPISGGDWLGAGMFFGFSVLGGAVALSAWRRARRGEAGAHPVFTGIAKAAPVLLLAGAVAGGWVTHRIQEDHFERLVRSAREQCALLNPDLAAAREQACVQAVFDCDRLRVRAPERLPDPSFEELRRLPEPLASSSEGVRRRAAFCVFERVVRGPSP